MFGLNLKGQLSTSAFSLKNRVSQPPGCVTEPKLKDDLFPRIEMFFLLQNLHISAGIRLQITELSHLNKYLN
jgi:hypothetical protein